MLLGDGGVRLLQADHAVDATRDLLWEAEDARQRVAIIRHSMDVGRREELFQTRPVQERSIAYGRGHKERGGAGVQTVEGRKAFVCFRYTTFSKAIMPK